jgi:hypothetical protein
MASLLIIEHRDGRQYAVSAADFRKTYEPEGFKAVRYEDGSEYEPPAQRATSAARADERAGE